VENLEVTKRTAAEIEVKAAQAKLTEVEINTALSHNVVSSTPCHE
jgi:hypothetical protein